MNVHALALHNIERKSNWLRSDAESVGRYVRMLDDLPSFETRAEDVLAQAELALTETLLAVKLAKKELADKSRALEAAE